MIIDRHAFTSQHARNPNARMVLPAKDVFTVVDEFDSTYWSGLQLSVYIDHIKLDDVVQLNFQVMEVIRPHYSYDSRVAKRINHGTRLIAGELTLNFKKDRFMFALLRAISLRMALRPSLEESPSTPPEVPFGIDVSSVTSLSDVELLRPEQVDLLMRQLLGTQPEGEEPAPVEVSPLSPLFGTASRGFTMSVIFGGHLGTGVRFKYLGNEFFELSGSAIEDVIPGKPPVATGIAFLGTSFSGFARNIDDSGRPIMDTYSFQARDIRILRPIPAGVSTTTAGP